MNIDEVLKQAEEIFVTDDDINRLCESHEKITSLDTKIDLNFEYDI